MKHCFALLFLATLPAGASQFGGLQPGATYLVWMDGQGQSYQTAANGTVSVNVPSGGHRIALQLVDSAPTPTSTPSPTITEEPSPTLTETPAATPSESPSASPSPTGTVDGREVIVGSFDELTLKNQFEV